MANEVKHPEEKKATHTPLPGNRTEHFWQKYSKIITYAVIAIIVVVGGYFAYQNLVVAPEEQKASEAMWKAEDYYRRDSSQLALNGDGQSLGFLKIISRYGGTKAAKLSKFYAGASYMKLGDFKNAIKYLQDFSTDDKLIMVRVAGLLGDAYAETGKKSEAAEQYKKAGTLFPDDNFNSPEYLFRAGLMYQDLGKNKEAVDMFTVIKNKYPGTERGQEIDKYLARLGELKIIMAEVSNSNLFKNTTGIPLQDACVVIVRTDWNAAVVDELEKGCRDTLRQHGLTNFEIIRVPGAVEIPFGIQKYWSLNQYGTQRPHAFIALGCVIRGGTPHFDYVCRSVTDGITSLNVSLPVPVIFGILTVDNQQQADERLGGIHGHKGEEAAVTAIKMISMVRSMEARKSSNAQ